LLAAIFRKSNGNCVLTDVAFVNVDETSRRIGSLGKNNIAVGQLGLVFGFMGIE
jgi:hypothetical protein